MHLLGGEVGVHSRSGAGATFWFELRFALAPAVPVDVAATDAPALPEPPLDARVLLVDDNPVNQLVVLAMLELLGCRVDLADDGQAACEAAAAQRYDVVLMDLHMPRMDGLSATACIRADAAGASRAAPIVALSAAALPEDRARCAAAGMADFIAKPVRLARLRECLAAQLDAARNR